MIRTVPALLLAALLALAPAAEAASPGANSSTHSSRDLWSSDQTRPNATFDPEASPRPGTFRYVSLSPIFFDHDQYTLSRESRMALDAAVDYLRRNEGQIKRILIEGFTDSRASLGYNDRLARRRIEMVRNYLLLHGIDASLLAPAAIGERAPTDINWTPLGRARNRQVVIHAVLWQP